MEAKTSPSIKLYTTHCCPATHRVLIILHELGLPYELENVDISKPRTPEFLAINPRGKVPAMIYDGNNIAESAIIAQFLVDAHQSSSLLPAPTGPAAALQRAKVAWFVDTFMQTVYKGYEGLIMARSEETAEEKAKTIATAVAKDIEPLLSDAKPYFGGSETLTMAEALTLPFFLRLYKLSSANVFPKWMADDFAEKAPIFHAWAQRGFEHPSVMALFDEAQHITLNAAHVKFMAGKSI